MNRAALFDSIPALLDDLDETARGVMRRANPTIPVLALPVGPWTPRSAVLAHATMGFIILDGYILRRLEVKGRASSELVGSGDVLLSRELSGDEPSSVPQTRSLTVLSRSRLGVLGADFARLANAWPSLYQGLLGRLAERQRRGMVQLSAARAQRAADRLLVILWDIADRWGDACWPCRDRFSAYTSHDRRADRH